MTREIQEGLYPLYEVKDGRGVRVMVGNGQYLALFGFRELGKDGRRKHYFQDSTALVRTLPIHDGIGGGILLFPTSSLRLEGDKKPNIHYMDKPIWEVEEKDIINFLRPNERVSFKPPKYLHDTLFWRKLNFIDKKDLDKYDPNKQFRNWNLNFRGDELEAVAHAFRNGERK